MILLMTRPAEATDLTGAWANDRAACGKVFAVKGKKISFHRNSDVHGSGFIIDGRQIRGRAATCRIIRTKVEENVVHMVASCATDVMLSNVQLILRIVNEDEVSRIFPGMQDMEIPYYRCPALSDSR
jgi:hypothetical protein